MTDTNQRSKQSSGRTSGPRKRLKLPALALTLVMPLGLLGCGQSQNLAALNPSVKGVLGSDLITAKGKTRDDQRKIDKTLERELADAEAQLHGIAFAPEDQAELAQSALGLQEADSLTAAYAQAAECLVQALV